MGVGGGRALVRPVRSFGGGHIGRSVWCRDHGHALRRQRQRSGDHRLHAPGLARARRSRKASTAAEASPTPPSRSTSPVRAPHTTRSVTDRPHLGRVTPSTSRARCRRSRRSTTAVPAATSPSRHQRRRRHHRPYDDQRGHASADARRRHQRPRNRDAVGGQRHVLDNMATVTPDQSAVRSTSADAVARRHGGDLVVTGSTFVGNSAAADGGAIESQDYCGSGPATGSLP